MLDDEKVERAMRYAHDTGFDEGWQQGYEDGWEAGYEVGYAEGVDSVDVCGICDSEPNI